LKRTKEEPSNHAKDVTQGQESRIASDEGWNRFALSIFYRQKRQGMPRIMIGMRMNYPAAELRGIKRNFHFTPMQSIKEFF